MQNFSFEFGVSVLDVWSAWASHLLSSFKHLEVATFLVKKIIAFRLLVKILVNFQKFFTQFQNKLVMRWTLVYARTFHTIAPMMIDRQRILFKTAESFQTNFKNKRNGVTKPENKVDAVSERKVKSVFKLTVWYSSISTFVNFGKSFLRITAETG